MVLRLLLIFLIFFQPVFLWACDPDFAPKEIISFIFEPALSPGVVFLSKQLAGLPGSAIPINWESISIEKKGSSDNAIQFNDQLFRLSLPLFGILAKKIDTNKNTIGRAILNISPTILRVSRDSLLNGGWQTLVMLISFPISSKIVIYRTDGHINYIDEIDSTISISATMSWPPVLLKHIRIWNHQGMIFSWPKEEISLSATQGETLKP